MACHGFLGKRRVEALKLTNKAVCTAIILGLATQASATNLYAVLEPDGNSYRLRNTFTTSPDQTDHFGLQHGAWALHSDDLTPAFPTYRIKCASDTSSCDGYKDLEAKFVHLNTFKSGYGDTPAERKAEEKPASEKFKSAAGTAAAGVLLAPAVIVSSPLILFGLAMKAKDPHKWAEFDHGAFDQAVEDAVKKVGFATRDDWTNNLKVINEIVARMTRYEDTAYRAACDQATQDRKAVAPYAHVGIATNSHGHRITRFVLPPIPIRADAIDETTITNQISRYYAAQTTEYAAMVKSEVERLKPSYEAKLAEIAEEERLTKLRAAEQERQAKLRAAEEERLAKRQAAEVERLAKIEEKIRKERERKELASLAQFRSKLEIGADTHCGPIIEIKGPMIKVAVNVPLSGYGTEAWLKRGEIYTPAYGCHNLNGKLSPLYLPG